MEQKLLAYLKEHEAEIFADLKELVLAEASTSDIDQLAHVREVLIRLIKELNEEKGVTVLCVSHDERIIAQGSRLINIEEITCAE